VLAAVRSAVLEGVDGRIVTVEVHVSRGLPGYTVVGLPDAAGRESRERVRAALLSSGARVAATARHGEPRARVGAQDRCRGLELGVALRAHLRGRWASVRRARPRRGARRARARRSRARGLRHRRLVDALARTGFEHVIVPAENASEAAHRAGRCGAGCALARRAAPVLERARHRGRSRPVLHRRLEAEPEGDEPLDLADVRGLDHARMRARGCGRGAHTTS